jgi:hypothetical protein
MNHRSKDIRLPDGLRRAAAELRQAEPSPDFERRFREALRSADQDAAQSATRAASGSPVLPPIFGGLQAWGTLLRTAGVATVGATVLLLAWVWFQPDGGESVMHRTEQLQLVLQDGRNWLPLTLATGHHDADHAMVSVEAPKELEVRASRHASEGIAPTCGPLNCVHRFAHPTSADEPHLAIGVSDPGEYRITVEHASPGQRVREVFLVAAQ